MYEWGCDNDFEPAVYLWPVLFNKAEVGVVFGALEKCLIYTVNGVCVCHRHIGEAQCRLRYSD